MLTAIRLYSKSRLTDVEVELKKLISSFQSFDSKHGSISMPGYTHMQKAMPSSIGLWSNSFVESLKDDVSIVKSAAKLIDQSPLGSAAGYGVPIELDKKYTAKLLAFANVQENPLYCQNSKGKFEAIIVSSLVNIMLTLNKFASDVMLFSTSEFGYFAASSQVTTGSSIMPQKKNLDLAELIRGKVHLVLGNYTKLVSLSSNLPSGYNRDLQDIKKPLMESLDTVADSLIVSQILLENITPNKEKLHDSMTEELFAAQKALDLVMKGESFRDAYKKIGLGISNRQEVSQNDN